VTPSSQGLTDKKADLSPTQASLRFHHTEQKIGDGDKGWREFSPPWARSDSNRLYLMYSRPAFAIFKVFMSGADKIYRDTVSTLQGWM
jgi:hypothetical protein